MKFGTIFFLLGLTALGALFLFDSVAARLPWAWLAFSFFAVSTAYLFRIPKIWLKRKDGRLPALSYFLFAPAHCFNWFIYESFRRAKHNKPFHEIVPGLLLGRRLIDGEQGLVAPLNLAAVLDLTSEFSEPDFLRGVPAYRCLPVLDTAAPTVGQINEGIRFIECHLKTGAVYVHCAAGHGRSALVAIAYLVASGRFRDGQAAHQFVKSRRAGVYLSRPQRDCLRAWEAANQVTP